MKAVAILVPLAAAALLAACSSDPSSSATSPGSAKSSGVRYRADVKPVTRVEDAKPGVFIPPFLDCRAPLAGESGTGPGGQVCTQVSIAGATEPGKDFAKYASCDVVRTQRPYYARARAKPIANKAALPPSFASEVEWARSEVASTGCACCHDSRVTPSGPSQWDIAAPGNWLETASSTGLALFVGLADSSVLGAFPPDQNHGFERTTVGVPSTDPKRMRKVVEAELARRGVSEAESRAVPPFGGPIYENSVRPPAQCGAGEGIDAAGRITFPSGKARYVFVSEAGSKNPGVPPNLDHPAGLLWRLDVLASGDPVESGLRYGTTPGEASFQDTPATGDAPPLVKGRTYQLVTLLDMGLPTTNCLFVFGEATEPPPPPPPPATATVEDAGKPGSDASTKPPSTFGVACATDATCSGVANYCAKMPGQAQGYCTATGCKSNASVCPSGWGCLDISLFQPGAPSICTKP